MEYTPEEKKQIIDEIFDLISKGDSLVKAMENSKIKTRRTFYKWIEGMEDGVNDYGRAREARQNHIFEEIKTIADDSSEDEIITEDGRRSFNGEFAARSRIKIDARKWMLGKMNPKKYGDKLDVTTKGEQIQSTDLSKLTYEQLQELSRPDKTGGKD